VGLSPCKGFPFVGFLPSSATLLLFEFPRVKVGVPSATDHLIRLSATRQ